MRCNNKGCINYTHIGCVTGELPLSNALRKYIHESGIECLKSKLKEDSTPNPKEKK